MNETFRSEENKRYSENHRSDEINPRTGEILNVSETKTVTSEYNSDAKAALFNRASAKSGDSAKKALSLSAALPTVGAVAGAAVITAAVAIVAVIRIALTALTVTATAIFAGFSLEGADGHTFTAYLSSPEENYISELEVSDGYAEIGFGDLIPGTQYLLEVKDETGKVHFSQSVATDPAGDLAYSVKYMNAFERVMAFDGQDLPETGLSVLVDGEKTDAVLDRENFVLHLNGLEGDREYLLEIYDGEKILLWEKFTTPAIGVAQPSAESTFESITVQFDMTNPHGEAVTLVYGTSAETLGRVPLGSGNVAETFTGLEAYTNYVFDVVRDSDGLKLNTFSARTDSRMIISANFVKETLDDEGRTVTLIPRGTDNMDNMFDDDPDALGVEIFAAAEPERYELEIVSESGYTLPFAIREITPDQPVNFTVYTEFAASGETYAIRLLADGEIGAEVVETRYIRIDDGESEVVYPEFTITVEPDKTTNGNYILGLIAEGAPLPEPATSWAGGYYSVEIMNAADNAYVGGGYFTEFATGETNTVVLEAVDPGVSDLEIQIFYFVEGFDSGYLIYSGISELSDIR